MVGIKHLFGKYLFPLVLLSFSVSCLSPDIQIQDDDSLPIPLSVCGSIDQIATKVNDSGFITGDAVGLFAVNYSNSNTVKGQLLTSGNQADNVKYVYDGKSWVPRRKVYYRDVKTNVDIYLYYPYSSTLSNVNEVSFEVAKDQRKAATSTSMSSYEASDFLWGVASNVVPTEKSVSIRMKHMMAGVVLTLSQGSGFSTGEFDGLVKNVIVNGTKRNAVIDYATGTVSAVGDPQEEGILMCEQGNHSFCAVVVPQMLAAETNIFTITVGGINYGFSQSSAVELKSGKQLQVNIKINKKSHTGQYELEPGEISMSDWKEDAYSHDGEALQYFVINVEKCGTLGQLLNQSKKNPNKIRNLKVTGNVSDNDYSFMRDSMAILESVNMMECNSSHEYTISCYIPGDLYPDYLGKYGQPDSVDTQYETAIWYMSEPGKIPDGAFYGKKSLSRFVFPEYVTDIGSQAFYGTSLYGALYIPDDVVSIGELCFSGLPITSVRFNDKIESIGKYAFMDCTSLRGSLMLPDCVKYIGPRAFSECDFSGRLILPKNLENIEERVFYSSGVYTDGLEIPDGVFNIGEYAFAECRFSGELKLSNVREIQAYAFENCHIPGELVLPTSLTSMSLYSPFKKNDFSKIVVLGSSASVSGFSENANLLEVEFKEGVKGIASGAFSQCVALQKIILPSTITALGPNAFAYCSSVSKIESKAVEPPVMDESVFYGVPKDNFALEVPAQSVLKYQLHSYWSLFKRIVAHHDFSISRRQFRTLNNETSETLVLRCPSGLSWSVESKPSWVTVSPENGVGKTEVKIIVNKLEKSAGNRNGNVVFSLYGKDYTCELEVDQYDYPYSDGEAVPIHKGTDPKCINVVFIGEGYDAKDISEGKYLSDSQEGSSYFFDVEPYATYKNYFNSYSLITMSPEHGLETENTVVDNRFIHDAVLNINGCFEFVRNALPGIDIKKTVIVLLLNDDKYSGITYMYKDGSALAVVGVSRESYPFDFRGLIQHEAGGHAFGKLGDEYIYHRGSLASCGCTCCKHPLSDHDLSTDFGIFKSLGWIKNLTMASNPGSVPWSHLLSHPKYSDYVSVFEGGYMHSNGVYRSEASSCMNNNIPYFSAISRQAIVERIMDYCGKDFSLELFYVSDKDDFGSITKSGVSDRFGGVDPNICIGPEHGSMVYMGEHPDL